MPTNAPAELSEMLHMVTQLFEYARAQGRQARENLHLSAPVADADSTERELHRRLLALGQCLMGTYFDNLGTGDLGYRATFDGQCYTRQHADRVKTILTIFGMVSFRQCLYYNGTGQSLRPVAAMANLPATECSYFAQDLLCRLALDDSYEQDQAFYKDLFGHSFSPTTIQQSVIATAAHDVAYQQDKAPPPPAAEGPIGVISFDGKGIPVRRAEQTTGIKREALIGVVYSIAQQARDAERLATALVMPELLAKHDEFDRPPVPESQHSRYHVSLGQPKEALFKEVQKCAQARFAHAGISTTVCLLDGATKLWELKKVYFPEAVGILDLMHVQSYLHEAAKALEPDLEKARLLVCVMLAGLLKGQHGKVIGSLKIRLAKKHLRGQRRKTVEDAIRYFDNHREHMRYDVYLAHGYPIATGVVESACGHLVKDRMEKAGARWSIRGAQALLKLRAVRANNDWHSYQDQRKHHERLRLYPTFLKTAA